MRSCLRIKFETEVGDGGVGERGVEGEGEGEECGSGDREWRERRRDGGREEGREEGREGREEKQEDEQDDE